MKVVLFTVPGSPPIVASVTNEEESDDYMTVEYPVVFLKEDTLIYTMPYMPLAKDGIVLINRKNVLSISSVDDIIQKEYVQLVSKLKLEKHVFKKNEVEVDKKNNIKQKIFH